MKKIKGIRGIRKRWMVNSISVVLFIVLLAVNIILISVLNTRKYNLDYAKEDSITGKEA